MFEVLVGMHKRHERQCLWKEQTDDRSLGGGNKSMKWIESEQPEEGLD